MAWGGEGKRNRKEGENEVEKRGLRTADIIRGTGEMKKRKG